MGKERVTEKERRHTAHLHVCEYVYIYIFLCMDIVAHSCSCLYKHFYSTLFFDWKQCEDAAFGTQPVGWNQRLWQHSLESHLGGLHNTHCPIMPHLNWSSMVLYNRLLQVLITCNDRLIDLIDCLLGSCQRDRRRGSIPISCSAKRPFHVPLAV